MRPTHAHYERQKSQSYAHFRVRALPEEREAMRRAQFTIYDFVTNAFAFSRPRKELAIRVFEELQTGGPLTFAGLHARTDAGKSALYLVLVALERSGLLERAGGRGAPYRLSGRFGEALREYAAWWERWAGVAGAESNGFKAGARKG